MNRKKIVILNSHPIQYFAPLYKEIEKTPKIDLEVWYCSKHGLNGEIDKQFGTSVKWDIPILEGYKYKFLTNYSLSPSMDSFFGLLNFGVIKCLYRLPKNSLVLVNGWGCFIYIVTVIFAKLFGHRVLMRGEAPLHFEVLRSNGIKKTFRELFFKGFFSLIDYFLYIGKQNKAFYQFYGVADSKLKFSPYCVDNARFQEDALFYEDKKEILKQELKIPTAKIILLSSGKYIHKKRPMDLLKAFSLINLDTVALIMVGDGELKSEMETFIEDKNLNNIVLTGFVNQSQISKYYAIADIYVMTSGDGETWGLSTNEAMNFGLPIILSDQVGCAADLIDDNGIIFETGNIIELKNAIKTLVEDEIRRTEAGRKSLNIISNYSYQKTVDTLKYL